MVCLTLEGSRLLGNRCLDAIKDFLGLKMLFWDLVTIRYWRGGVVGGLVARELSWIKGEGWDSLPDGGSYDKTVSGIASTEGRHVGDDTTVDVSCGTISIMSGGGGDMVVLYRFLVYEIRTNMGR